MRLLNKLSRTRLALASLAALLAIALSVAYARPSAPKLRQAIFSSVYIVSLNDDGKPLARGSGTILDPKGLILTNFHVVASPDKEALCNEQGIVAVLITRDPRENAVPTYLAKVVRYDAKLDLAAIQVIADLQGNKLSTPPTLPSIPVGDSAKLTPGDPITIVGYPGLGMDTVTVTGGSVSGFLKDEYNNTLMKTDAEINPGNSGGTALNDEGELIGVPTFTSEGKERIGKIGLIRPVDLAKPLLSNLSGAQPSDRRQAPNRPGRNEGNEGDDLGRADRTNPLTGGPRRGDGGGGGTMKFVGFTTSRDAEQVSESAPSGTRELYAFFEFKGMNRRTAYSSTWSLDGKKIQGTDNSSDTWPFDPGDGGGVVYIQSENGLPDGTYGVSITGGRQTIEGQIAVGTKGSPGEDNRPRMPRRQAAKSVKLHGQVISADSEAPLQGAVFIILMPGVNWKKADLNNSDHIFDAGRTDANGRFETNRALDLETEYSIGFVAQGYEPAGGDGFRPSKFYQSGSFIDMGVIGLKAAR